MVSTLDFESSYPSSNLGGVLLHFYYHYPKAYSETKKQYYCSHFSVLHLFAEPVA